MQGTRKYVEINYFKSTDSKFSSNVYPKYPKDTCTCYLAEQKMTSRDLLNLGSVCVKLRWIVSSLTHHTTSSFHSDKISHFVRVFAITSDIREMTVFVSLR